jgi:hypothetical protein
MFGGLATSCAPAVTAPAAPPAPPAPTAKADKAFGQVLADYGFVELRPPSTLLPPGTIVRLKSREPLQAGIVCTQRAALGPALDLASSDSKATSLGSLDGAGYALDGSALPFLRVKAQYAAVERVTMHLSNVRVIEIPDSTVYDGLARRSSGCKKALKGLASDPAQTVSMIKSVLVADVSYGVDFRSSANLDAAARVSIVQSLGADLGANSSTATAGTVSGTALYWGATDDVQLVKTAAAPVLHASGRSSYSSPPPAAITGVPLGDTGAETPQPPESPAPPVHALTPTSGGLQIDPTPMAAD